MGRSLDGIVGLVYSYASSRPTWVEFHSHALRQVRQVTPHKHCSARDIKSPPDRKGLVCEVANQRFGPNVIHKLLVHPLPRLFTCTGNDSVGRGSALDARSAILRPRSEREQVHPIRTSFVLQEQTELSILIPPKIRRIGTRRPFRRAPYCDHQIEIGSHFIPINNLVADKCWIDLANDVEDRLIGGQWLPEPFSSPQ